MRPSAQLPLRAFPAEKMVCFPCCQRHFRCRATQADEAPRLHEASIAVGSWTVMQVCICFPFRSRCLACSQQKEREPCLFPFHFDDDLHSELIRQWRELKFSIHLDCARTDCQDRALLCAVVFCLTGNFLCQATGEREEVLKISDQNDWWLEERPSRRYRSCAQARGARHQSGVQRAVVPLSLSLSVRPFKAAAAFSFKSSSVNGRTVCLRMDEAAVGTARAACRRPVRPAAPAVISDIRRRRRNRQGTVPHADACRCRCSRHPRPQVCLQS